MEASCTTYVMDTQAVVRRVNQLYHDLTQDTFDIEHHARHRVEQQFWSRIADLLDGHTDDAVGRTVVDLACGTGFVTQILGRALSKADRMIAIDVSTAALRTTSRKWAKNDVGRRVTLAALASDGASLPLADCSVDLFAINAALHHMPDPAAVLCEIDRVLRPGGLFALGFEPNTRHFASPIGRVARAFDRLAWYASPRQNLRRMRSRLGLCGTAGDTGSRLESDRIAAIISRTLDEAACCSVPLDGEKMLDLVDPHARGAKQAAGFDPTALKGEHFAGYDVLRLFTSDYLGESPRRFRAFRTLVDASLRACLPVHGSLFSWILRKPDRQGGACRS